MDRACASLQHALTAFETQLLNAPPRRSEDHMQRKLVARLSVTLVALMGLLLFALPSAGAATVEPTVVDGNPKCGDIASNLVSLTKFDNDPTGSLSQDGVSVTIDGTTIDWTSETPVYAVIVKGGDNSNVYLYDGGATSDSGLTTVTNPLNGQPYTVSHVEFCGDPSAGASGGGSGDSGGGTVDGGGSGDSGGGTVDGGGSSDDGSGGTVDGGGSSGDNSGSNDNSGGKGDNSGGSNGKHGGT